MEQLKWHQLGKGELTQALNSIPEQGLAAAEAAERLQRDGHNELTEGKRVSPFMLFLNQFKDFMVLVLMGATLISGLLGEYLDAVTIIAIIVINSVLGFVQEFRAEKSLHALKEMSAPSAKVLRGGQMMDIPARELVVGDVIVLESGDRIPADVRLLEANSCYTEESALTGESVPVGKHAMAISEADLPLGDQRNIGFMGTMVTRGTAKGMVIRTGMKTEMGTIAELIQQTESMETPLQHRLEQLGKILIAVAIGLTIIVVAAGILHGQPAYGMFLAGVSLAVAAIPEGLPAIVTIALALGVQRMIKRKAIVRKLPSVETLGCASVICSDKTGTLTQNKMTVTTIWMGGRRLDVTGQGYEPVGAIMEGGEPVDMKHDASLKRLLQIAALCNNASIYQVEPEEGRKRSGKNAGAAKQEWVLSGDPTEGALVVLAAKLGLTAKSLEGLYKREREFPFDSERKLMSVLASHQGGRVIYAKGAPDVLMHQCSYVLWDGKVVPFTGTLKKKYAEASEEMAQSALRVLGLAYRDLRATDKCNSETEAESQLVFVGLTGMIDPPRREAREAIAVCRRAGIKTVMITGDHQLTAEAIAGQLGIMPRGGIAMSGKQLESMSDEQLDRLVDNVYVYARVSPSISCASSSRFSAKGMSLR